jgi:hypothetical protein
MDTCTIEVEAAQWKLEPMGRENHSQEIHQDHSMSYKTKQGREENAVES